MLYVCVLQNITYCPITKVNYFTKQLKKSSGLSESFMAVALVMLCKSDWCMIILQLVFLPLFTL